ncbi:MAG: hypothetical protein JWP97_3380 [Labilithrix sp.]|nr:hypothetical protein [Labilithrix sp.]
MPLLLALPVGLVIGMTLAWVARAELGRSEVPLLSSRPFLVALGLGLVVFGPVVGSFAVWHGDWTYLYLLPSSRVPSAVDLFLVLLAAAQVPLGFAIATPWSVARRGARIFQVAGGLVLAVALATALLGRRLAVSASFAQYHAGFGNLPLGRSPLGRTLLLSWLALAAAYGWSAYALRSSRER